MNRALRITLSALLLRVIAGALHATVYINRDYYWDNYNKVWAYNIVDRHYGSTNPTTWGVASDFGMQGTGSPYVLEAEDE